MTKFQRVLTASVLSMFIAGCQTTVGGGDPGQVTGSAGPGAESDGETVELKRCPEQLATAAILDNRVDGKYLAEYGVPTDPKPPLRLILQQSNCVQVVHRDIALQAMKDERELAESGELQASDTETFGKGQVVAAEYSIIPEISFSEENAGGAGAMIGSVLGSVVPFGGVLGLAAGGAQFQEAQVILTLVDNRTGEQVAVASGTGSGTSFGGFAGGFGSVSLAAGGYQNTNQGKVVMAAMIDAMNNLTPHLMANESSS